MNFWDFFWLMVWGFFFVMYLMVLLQVIIDIFRDRTMNGWAKAVWLLAVFVAAPVTVLVYVIVRGKGMSDRASGAAYGGSDPASQIARGKELLDAGTITEAEFGQLKGRALL